MHPRLLSVSLALGLSSTAFAATPSKEVSRDLDRIVVTATRTERVISDVPGTVDVIDRAQMDAQLVRNPADLFRYEPGVSVGGSFGRFGRSDIRIRGLGGNRVRLLTDGVAVPDAFAIGSFSNANRDFVDLDTLKRVEVVRGPASSLYGSDALGGVVAFVTRDPADYLQPGRDAYFGMKLGVDGRNDGLFASATAAMGGDRWSGLLTAGHRQGREMRNMGEVGGAGAARTRANPQSANGRSVLGKLVFAPSPMQRFRVTLEGNEDDVETDLLASRGLQPMTGATNLQVLGRDHQSRARVSFGQEADGLDSVLADSLDWLVYRQDSMTRQDSIEHRRVPAATGFERDRREREFHFDQRSYGLQLNLRRTFQTGDATHALAYGVDLQRIRTRQKRDGRRVLPDTGEVTNVMLPDIFPVRDFPLSTTSLSALYLQDEIGLAGDRLRLLPAVRVDRYRLSPRVDNIFREDNPDTTVASVDLTRVSPKFGVVWKFTDRWSVYGSYARGFRAPPYNDVNIGFTNFMFGYTAIPNPDLAPETSDGLELGLRFSGDAVYASLGVYDTEYDEFIESTRFTGIDPATGLMVYQSQNVEDARIRGVEFSGGLHLDALTPALDGWSLRGAAAWSRGENRDNGEALASVDPLTATLGIAVARDTWGAELAGRFVARHDRLPSAPVGSSYFESPGYAVFDLYAHWRFTPGVRVDAGLTNLGDRRFWPSGLVPVVASGSATLDRYTAPGRALLLSLSVEF